MFAVCFKCGQAKKVPLKMCANCHALPENREEMILSMGLSTDCIREENVEKAGKYIRKKGRPPLLHEKVRAKAAKLARRYQPVDVSGSMELSASFFELDDLIEDDSSEEVLDIVVVHSIGRPANGEFAQLSSNATYFESTWTVGIDISEENVAKYADGKGELYVWFRWVHESWQPKFISKKEFENLRSLSVDA